MFDDFKFWLLLIVVVAGMYYGYLSFNNIDLLYISNNQPDEPQTDTTETTTPPLNDDEVMTVTFIETGHGEATYVEFPHGRNMLIDCGPEKYDAELVDIFLRNKGITQIDYMVVTHPDPDHYGGCHRVFDNYDVTWIYDNGEHDSGINWDYYTVDRTRRRYKMTREDVNIPVDKFVSAKIIAPHYGGSSSDPDSNSLVVLLKYGDSKILITGDCNTECEDAILSELEQVQVLQVSNSGDRSGTSDIFLDVVMPNTAVISVDPYTPEMRPHKEVIDRLAEHSIIYKRTDEEGDIIVRCDGVTCDYI